MNAISPLVSSSRQYKIAAELLEAGIDYLREKYRHGKYLREIHPQDTSVIEMMGATTDLPATDIILHLIDGERVDTENHRFTRLNLSLEHQCELSGFKGGDRRHTGQPLSAAIRDSE